MATSTDIFTQKDRLLSITTPLGADKLLLRAFSGQEAISQLFRFQLDLLSEDHAIRFNDIVGREITLGIKLADGTRERYFNGIVSRFAQMPREGRLAHYQAEMVPSLWLLTRTADCRIFQNQAVPDILTQVFKDFGVRHVENRLQRQYVPWDYCVQYRETACNFVMRLMEQEGIFFFFQHDSGKHVLVLADLPSAHKPCPYQSKVRYEQVTGPGFKRGEDLIFAWRREQELRPGKYTVTDFNFETPSTDLLASAESPLGDGGGRVLEIYDYPGEYEKRAEGEAESKVRIEEEELTHTIITGSGDCRSLASGFRFDLEGCDRKDQNGAYVLTAVTHQAREGGFYSGAGGDEPASYENTFTAIPHPVPFRPPRVTPKPVVQGSQTAIVVGPAGEEIYTDKYGRVKVQFHWDRVGKRDEKSSCWVRVSHPWAGKGWGAIAIPRIGQEVIVDFLEGDPDRPIIVGRVYNAEQMPPYGLPDNSTQSGIKTRSSKGGAASNCNEIRLEDKKGSEEFFIQAEKDENIVVKNNKTETVGVNETISIGNDRAETVGANESLAVAKNRQRTVGENESVTVGVNRTHTVGADETISVGANQAITIGANQTNTIGANRRLSVGESQNVNIGANLSEAIGSNHTNDVGANRTTSIGSNDTLSVGSHLKIEVGSEIVIQTGASKIVMTSGGDIKISGVSIKIEGTSSIKNGAATITSEASAIHTIKGSLVKIN